MSQVPLLVVTEEKMAGMAKEEESGSPSWGASFFMQTTEDVARAVAAAMNSPKPSVIYSSKTDHGSSQLQRLQYQVTKMIKGLSQDHRSWKEPTRLFESMVVVGLHPNCDIQALQRQYFVKKSEGSGKLRSALGPLNSKELESLERQLDSSLKQIRSTRMFNTSCSFTPEQLKDAKQL